MIAAVIAAFLAGLAIGAVVMQRVEDQRLRGIEAGWLRTAQANRDAARWWQRRWVQTERARRIERDRADRAVAALREDVRQP